VDKIYSGTYAMTLSTLQHSLAGLQLNAQGEETQLPVEALKENALTALKDLKLIVENTNV
jgi:hypothetical protein